MGVKSAHCGTRCSSRISSHHIGMSCQGLAAGMRRMWAAVAAGEDLGLAWPVSRTAQQRSSAAVVPFECLRALE